MFDNVSDTRESSTTQSNSGTTNSSSILGKAPTNSYLTKLKNPNQIHMLQYNRQKLEQTQSSIKESSSYKEKNLQNSSYQNQKNSLSPRYSPQKLVKLVYQNTPSTLEAPNLFDRKQDVPSLYSYEDQNEIRTTIPQSQGDLQEQTEIEKAGTEAAKSYEDYYAEFLRWSNQNKKEMSDKKAKLNDDTDEYYEVSKQSIQGSASQQKRQKSTEIDSKRQSLDKSRVKDVMLQKAGVNDALKEIQLEENKGSETKIIPPPKKEPEQKPSQKKKPAADNKEEKQVQTKSSSFLNSIAGASNVDFLKYCNTSRKIRMLKEGEKLLQKMERDTKLNDNIPSKLVEEPIIQKKEVKKKPNSERTLEREKTAKGKTRQRETEKIENPSITFDRDSMVVAVDGSLADLPSDRGSITNVHERSISLQEIDSSKMGFKAGKAAKLKTIISQINNRDLRQPSLKKAEAEEIRNLVGRGVQFHSELQQIEEISSPVTKKHKQISRETSIERTDLSFRRQEEKTFEMRRIGVDLVKKREKAQTMQDIDTSRSKHVNRDPEESKEQKQDDIFVQVMPTKPPRKMSENAQPVQSKVSNSTNTQKAKARSTTVIGSQTIIQDKENPREVLSSKNQGINSESIKEKAISALTEEEKLSYGDRFPSGYKKVSFLGRGGFALVWLGVQEATGVKVAVKQIILQKAPSTVMNEVAVGRMLFQGHSTNQSKLQSYPGISNIIQFIDCIETTLDLWMIFELGGATLSKSLFEIKGEFVKGERIYGIKYMHLFKMFQENARYLKAFVRQMAEVLKLLSDLKVVHCDIKPDNILIQDQVAANGDPFTMKMIDFGSAFSLKDVGSLGMATPEYMPPEVLKLIISNQSGRSSIEELARTTPPWAVDTWSLGAMLLEILSGIPLWMSLRSRVEQNGKKFIKTGLLAVKGRAYDKIRIRQKAVVEGLEETARGYLKNFKDSEYLMDLLLNLLHLDPKKRISPQEILKHPYLADEN